MKKETYDDLFYKDMYENTKYAATKILSILNDLAVINSVVDLGCGIGAWLCCAKNVFSRGGGTDIRIRGLDGPYVPTKYRVISEQEFYPTDLSKPININERFDLVISLEVAEHLPENRAEGFVRDLCLLGDIILFSAAVPRQGGTEHINEQWQTYWANKFDKNGFDAFDIIRPKIYDDYRVPLWYRNNMIVYVKRNTKLCEQMKENVDSRVLDMLLPEMHKKIMNELVGEYEAKLNLLPVRFIMRINSTIRKIWKH